MTHDKAFDALLELIPGSAQVGLAMKEVSLTSDDAKTVLKPSEIYAALADLAPVAAALALSHEHAKLFAAEAAADALHAALHAFRQIPESSAARRAMRMWIAGTLSASRPSVGGTTTLSAARNLSTEEMARLLAVPSQVAHAEASSAEKALRSAMPIIDGIACYELAKRDGAHAEESNALNAAIQAFRAIPAADPLIVAYVRWLDENTDSSGH